MKAIDFEKGNELVPAIIQDASTNKVLMLGYMNAEAVEATQVTRRVTFFSRSKNRLWVKGETSGNFLLLVSINIDCDRDTLLIKVIPQGPTCHQGADTCWNEENKDDLGFLRELDCIIQDRLNYPAEKSYTTKMFQKGLKKMGQKVGEEGVEVALEAESGSNDQLLNESADLIYHLMILLRGRGFGLNDVVNELENRS